jgi:hypothetical protein
MVGAFDSDIGSLTVARAIMERLPGDYFSIVAIWHGRRVVAKALRPLSNSPL